MLDVENLACGGSLSNADHVIKRTMMVRVYSNNWVHESALVNFFRMYGGGVFINSESESESESELNLFNNVESFPPTLIVLDTPPRESIALVINIRKQWPSVYILFTQKYFLFSDTIVVDFFSDIELLTYDDVMILLRGVCFSHNSVSGLLSYCSHPKNMIVGVLEEEYVMEELNILLHRRLSAIISPRGAYIVLKWLIRDIPLKEMCRRSGMKPKTIYYYRELTMNQLGIRHFARDFRASLTFVSEPCYTSLIRRVKYSEPIKNSP